MVFEDLVRTPALRLSHALIAASCALIAAFALVLLPATAAAGAGDLLRQLQAGAGVPASEQNAEDLALLARFYQERQMRPLWITDAGATERGVALAAILEAADQDGLDPEDYGASEIAALLASSDLDDLAELELRLSLGLMRFVSDLASGRLEPSKINPELFVYPQNVNHAEVIGAAADAEDIAAFVARFPPAQDEYRRLKAALADFRARAATTTWVTVPDGPTLDGA